MIALGNETFPVIDTQKRACHAESITEKETRGAGETRHPKEKLKRANGRGWLF